MEIRKSEIFVLLRLIVFNASILSGVWIWRHYDAVKSDPKQVIVRIPHKCSYGLIKGVEAMGYDCFRAFRADIKTEKETGTFADFIAEFKKD